MDRIKLKHVLTLAILSVVVALAFQNCADPLNLNSSVQAALSDNLPFAYDATVDTISYMSCDGNTTFNPRAVYTLRAGAYNTVTTTFNSPTTGLGLTPDMWTYLQQTQGMLNRAAVLQNASQVVGSNLQLSIRQASNLQNVLTVTSGQATPNVDYWNMYDGNTLDSEAIVDRVGAFTSSTQKISYFSGIPGLDGRLLEGSLYFNSNSTQGQSLLTQMIGSGYILALTYSTPGAALPVLAQTPPGAPANQAYGHGFSLGFTYDYTNFSNSDARILNQVYEVDLSTGLTSGSNIGTWTCASTDYYQIIRADDAINNTSFGYQCVPESDAVMLGNFSGTALTTAQLRLAKIRNVLRPEDWYVDLVHQCVIPKQTQNNGSNNDACYGPIPSGTTINYNFNVSGTSFTYKYCTETANSTSICPHYVSVCTRQTPTL